MTELFLSLLAAILAITLHEAAHGYAALALGDDTAKRMGPPKTPKPQVRSESTPLR